MQEIHKQQVRYFGCSGGSAGGWACGGWACAVAGVVVDGFQQVYCTPAALSVSHRDCDCCTTSRVDTTLDLVAGSTAVRER